MSDQTSNTVQMMQQEFGLLAKACTQLKTHPALTELRHIGSLTADHVGLMLHYAGQLDTLFATIRNHAATMQKLAGVDMDAAQFSAIANRTVADLTKSIAPVIDNLRRQAATLDNRHAAMPAGARMH